MINTLKRVFIPIVLFSSAILSSYANVYDGKKDGMPDFMIIGVDKCGTTSLYSYLVQHPQIIGAKEKEIHFFDWYFNKGIKWYKSQFPQETNGKLIGEASPGYFWRKTCLQKIAQLCSHTKFIISLRDPVKRLISKYLMYVRMGIEKEPFEKAVFKSYRKEAYLTSGCYIAYLEQWLSCFPRNQFHIVILEDLAQNPEQEVNNIFKFLGLNEIKLASYDIKNKSSTSTDKTAVRIKKSVLQKIKHFYAPYNNGMEKILNRKLQWNCS